MFNRQLSRGGIGRRKDENSIKPSQEARSDRGCDFSIKEERIGFGEKSKGDHKEAPRELQSEI